MKLTDQAITDTWKQYWPLCVQAKSDTEFEVAWTNLQQALKSVGIDEYTEFRSDSYKNNLILMGQ
jgi:hypothetical protein